MTAIDPNRMTLAQHIDDLRKRILKSLICVAIASVLCYNWYAPISAFFMSPFNGIDAVNGQLTVTRLYDGFFIKIKLSILSGIVCSIPVIAYQFGRFIIPGLTRQEIKWLFIGLLSSAVLCVLSTYMVYAIMLPYIIPWVLSADFVPPTIHILLNFNQNMGYALSFLLGSIVVFQSPIIVCFLLAKNRVSRAFLWRNSRFFVVGIVIVSAILTPPDIVSQISLSAPLILAYFGCIGLAKLLKWGETC
jgi:sec-independent protein translocase protein TatC